MYTHSHNTQKWALENVSSTLEVRSYPLCTATSICHYLRSLPIGFIGYAPDVYAIVSDHPIADRDDDQLYYTQIFLDKEKRVRVSRAHLYSPSKFIDCHIILCRPSRQSTPFGWTTEDTFSRISMEQRMKWRLRCKATSHTPTIPSTTQGQPCTMEMDHQR